MSETEDPRRSRRRASRTVGPPVGEQATEQPTTDESRATASQVSTPVSSSAERTASKRSAGTPSTSAKTEKVSTEKTVPGSVTSDSSGAESSADAETAGATDATDPSAESTERIAAPGRGGVLSRLPFTSKRRKEAESTNKATTDLDDPASSGADDTTVVHLRSATESDSHSEDDTDESTGSKPRRSKKAILASVAAVVLVLGMVSVAVLSVFAVQSTEERDANRAEYVQTARQTVINLTTISADSAKEDIQRVLTMASGEFKTEFDGRIDPFTEIVKQAEVTSNGEVIEAAIENEDEKSARVLVAAKQTLTNAGQEEPQDRFYRFRVTVARGDDGNLSASNVEFVA